VGIFRDGRAVGVKSSRTNAHARGERNWSATVIASANSEAPIPARQIGIGEGAHAQGPKGPSVTVLDPESSSQQRLYPMKFRNRPCIGIPGMLDESCKSAVNTSATVVRRDCVSAHASRSARALSSTQ